MMPKKSDQSKRTKLKRKVGKTESLIRRNRPGALPVKKKISRTAGNYYKSVTGTEKGVGNYVAV